MLALVLEKLLYLFNLIEAPKLIQLALIPRYSSIRVLPSYISNAHKPITVKKHKYIYKMYKNKVYKNADSGVMLELLFA